MARSTPRTIASASNTPLPVLRVSEFSAICNRKTRKGKGISRSRQQLPNSCSVQTSSHAAARESSGGKVSIDLRLDQLRGAFRSASRFFGFGRRSGCRERFTRNRPFHDANCFSRASPGTLFGLTRIARWRSTDSRWVVHHRDARFFPRRLCILAVVRFFARSVAAFVVVRLEVREMEGLFAPVPLVDDSHRIRAGYLRNFQWTGVLRRQLRRYSLRR